MSATTTAATGGAAGVGRYVCGVTPLKLWEFASAYFVGALKVRRSMPTEAVIG